MKRTTRETAGTDIAGQLIIWVFFPPLQPPYGPGMTIPITG
jgi:hypothetical protein